MCATVRISVRGHVRCRMMQALRRDGSRLYFAPTSILFECVRLPKKLLEAALANGQKHLAKCIGTLYVSRTRGFCNLLF